MTTPEPFSSNAVLDGAYLDLPGDTLAAAAAFVRRHGADDPAGHAGDRRWVVKGRNYTFEGYDPNDGLTGGRWMRDTWGVVVWVQTDQPVAEEDSDAA